MELKCIPLESDDVFPGSHRMIRYERYKTIPTTELRLGMFVHDSGRSWLQHPWLKRRKIITSRGEIGELLAYGINEVVIDLSKGVTPVASQPGEEKPELHRPERLEEIEKRKGIREEPDVNPISQEAEYPAARRVYTHALAGVRSVLATSQAFDTVDIEMVCRMVDEIINSVNRNGDAFVSLLKLKQFDHYDFVHPLNASVVALSFGKHLGFNREQLKKLGLGVLLQDIGKTQIPRDILYKPGRLDADEFEVVKKHALHGAHFLQKLHGLPQTVPALALYHHERSDGSGYPKQLKGRNINPYYIIGALADVFDAVSGDRVYKKAVRPFQAILEIFKMRDVQFPATWVDRFIQYLGIYPTGTVVKLNTGEVGVVVGVNHAQLLKPRIKLVTDAQGRPLARVRAINLNTNTYLDRKVVSVLDPAEMGIIPAKYVDPNEDVS